MEKKTPDLKINSNTFIIKLLSSLIMLSLIIGCSTDTTQKDAQEDGTGFILYDYVHTKDPAFKYDLMHTSKEKGYTFHVVKMVSQNWLSTDLVDETEWWHWITLVVPDELQYQTAMLMIGGGNKDKGLPEKADANSVQMALATQSVVANLHNVPFQPLTFAGDDYGKRVEDELIAYGWRRFLEGGAKDEDAVWLARLPMTKAAVSAMDVVTEVINSEYEKSIEKYVVAGGSKRGWTTWTTAAVDDRVEGIIPIVIDLLNLVPSFHHHWRSYGFWAPYVGNYVHEGIMDWQGSAEYDKLVSITEPYSFIDLYTMPKLLINATGDQFFLPDSWQFYWDDLIGEKHLCYVPNAGHGLKNSDAPQIILSFYRSILNKEKRPQYSWALNDEGFIIETDPNNPPASIKLWQAHNPETRDFRIDVFGPGYVSSDIEISSDGKYSIKLDDPEKGWKACFVELSYPGEVPLKFTTGVKVIPDVYPFDEFVPVVQKGTLP
jgi:PhoPQ-activated pathogenicity-related protein